MFRVHIILILLYTAQPFLSERQACLAQEVIRTSGSAQVRVENNKSREEAMEEAGQLARINAIEAVFGAYVEQDSDVDIDNGKASFKIIGHSLVRGDWLKTISEKFSEENRTVGKGKDRIIETWITCRVEGLTREITSPGIQLNIVPMNCLNTACRTFDFLDGEPFYLRFSSAADGYLTLYAVQQDEKAYRLLPYRNMPDLYLDAVPVTADREYLFFAAGEQYDYFEGYSWMMVDELIMTTGHTKEYMDLYVVFSTGNFQKPLINFKKTESNPDIPASLSKTKFLEWLRNNRVYNPDLFYKRITLTIKK